MSSIFVLGPSEWLKPRRKPFSAVSENPLDARRGLAKLIGKHGISAVVMEDEPEQPGEAAVRKFRRILMGRKVGTILVFWPLGAKLHGLEVEIGFLLKALTEDAIAPDRIVILCERQVMAISSEGVLSLNEPGNRTRYHQDLIDLGCPVRRWTSVKGLIAQVANICHEHSLGAKSGGPNWILADDAAPGRYHWACGRCQKLSYRSFATALKARTDADRHRTAIHVGEEAGIVIARRDKPEPLVPGPFRAVCGKCLAEAESRDFENQDEADEAAERHRRERHSGEGLVVVLIAPSWTAQDDWNKLAAEAAEAQARAEKGEGPTGFDRPWD
jgi:hypothetical protein